MFSEGAGCVLTVREVTTPNEGAAPRMALGKDKYDGWMWKRKKRTKNMSWFWVALAVMMLPFAKTTCAWMTASSARPHCLDGNPKPHSPNGPRYPHTGKSLNHQ